MKPRAYRISLSVGLLLPLFLATGCSSSSPADDIQVKLLNELKAVSAKLDALSDNSDVPRTPSVHERLLEEFETVSHQLNVLAGDPDAARTELDRLQNEILTVDDAALQELATEYREFRESLPALAGIVLSPELAATDWIFRIHLLLVGDWNVDALLEAEEMMEQVPLSVTQVTANRLAERIASKTIGLAEKSLTDETPADTDTVSIVIESVERLIPASDGPPDELTKLLELLAARLGIVEQERRAAELATESSNIQNLIGVASQIPDPELRWSALSQLNENVDAVRLQLAAQGHELPAVLTSVRSQLGSEISKTRRDLARKQEAGQNKARMRYQAWALAEIQKMSFFLDKARRDRELYRLRDIDAKSTEPVNVAWADFAGVRKLFEDGIGQLGEGYRLTAGQRATVGKFVSDNWYPLVYQVQHDAAVRHLLPINQNLLDPPVAKFYSEAFENAWQQIADGRDLQLSLAKQSAQVRKRSLESFIEASDE